MGPVFVSQLHRAALDVVSPDGIVIVADHYNNDGGRSAQEGMVVEMNHLQILQKADAIVARLHLFFKAVCVILCTVPSIEHIVATSLVCIIFAATNVECIRGAHPGIRVGSERSSACSMFEVRIQCMALLGPFVRDSSGSFFGTCAGNLVASCLGA
jgi:dolichol kinase